MLLFYDHVNSLHLFTELFHKYFSSFTNLFLSFQSIIYQQKIVHLPCDVGPAEVLACQTRPWIATKG